MLVTHLHLVEFSTCSVSKLGLTLLLFLGDGVVDLDVQFNQRVDAALFYHLLAAPGVIRQDQLTKLGAPVAKVVNAKAFVACKLVHLLERVTDNGGAQVTDVEGLCDVGRGIVKHDLLAAADVGCAVALLLLQHLGKHLIYQVRGRNADIEVAVDCLCAFHASAVHAVRQRLRDHDGCATQRLGELKARQRKVAHACIGRILQHTCQIVHRQLCSGVDTKHAAMHVLCDKLFDFQHSIYLNPSKLFFTICYYSISCA